MENKGNVLLSIIQRHLNSSSNPLKFVALAAQKNIAFLRL